MSRTAASIAAEFRVRLPYVLEALEQRRLLTITAFDATVGAAINGPVATGLVLPAYASGPELMNVTLNGQYDYTPTAVLQPDGTYSLYTDLVPQHAGSGELSITFRNDRTGGWDILETGAATVNAAAFSAVVADDYQHDALPGTPWTTPLTRFEASPQAGPLDQYDVTVDWFGESKAGRLARLADGTVGAFVDDAYLPTGPSFGAVSVNIRPNGAPADAPLAGYGVVNFSVGTGIGIGTFHAVLNDGTDLQIRLPAVADHGTFNRFSPVAAATGWPSTFAVKVLWQHRDDNVGESTGSVVREADGSHSVHVAWPTFATDGGQIKIYESVHRPAIGNTPAATYTVEYVGSFAGSGDPIEIALPPGSTPPALPTVPPAEPETTPHLPPPTMLPLPPTIIGIDLPWYEPVFVPTPVPMPVVVPEGPDMMPPEAELPTVSLPSPAFVVTTETSESEIATEPLSKSILSTGDDTLFGDASEDLLTDVVR